MKFGDKIKKLDLTKPRFRDTKFRRNVLSIKSHSDWKKKNKDKKLNKVQFDKVCKKLLEKYRDHIVYNTDGVQLPYYLGDISVNYLIFPKSIDYKKSQEEGLAIRNFNWDTYNKIAKIVWQRKNAIRFNKGLDTLAFQAVRKLQRQASNYMKKNPGVYKTRE